MPLTEALRTDPLSDEVVELVSERMWLLGHGTRIRIMRELQGQERSVQAVADALMTTQQNVSGHLRLLLAAGVVSRRASGRHMFYSA
jgi:DNA-binding transcriptional ArsR family regulator